MDGIALLRVEAIQKRNATILAAKREYALTLKEIAVLQRRLNLKSPKSPRSPLSARNVVAVAREILNEGKPMTNAHSKSLRHHTAMQALFVAWYNFGRKHETLRGRYSRDGEYAE